MNEFERTDWADSNYSIIGRALTIASRFEAICKALNTLIGLKENRDILDSEEEISKFVTSLKKPQLIHHVTAISQDQNELQRILNKGRLARNQIAHEITIGLDRSIDTLEEKDIESLMNRLRGHIIDLAEADRSISLITSIVSNESLPSSDFLKEYPQLIEKWVMEK